VTHMHAASQGEAQVFYTYCHLLHAGSVDHELGWVARELTRHGANLSYFLSVPEPDFYPHYTHGLDALFRFGGCIPAIHVKADLADTVLLGLQWFWEGGGMLVRADDDIHRVADLAGRRVGLSRSLNAAKVDYRRVTEERGLELVLRLQGVRHDDLRIVDCPFPDDWYEGQRMAEPLPDLFDFWRAYGVQADLLQRPLQPELEAGLIDACFVTDPFGLEYAGSEAVRLVGSLARQPDRTLQIGGAPYALTCTRRFADEHPELVTAYLQGLIRTGRWCNSERQAAAALLEATGFFPPAATVIPAIEHLDLVPNLSAANLTAIHAVMESMLERGHLRRGFDVGDWAAPEFLQAATRALDEVA
jgi:ABC-type nitrate/sulfonate/bicarbonate transport system substrate-binding protein